MSVETNVRGPGQPGKGQPDAFEIVDSSRIAEMPAKANLSGKARQALIAPAGRHGHAPRRRQGRRAGHRLILPPTTKANAMRIHLSDQANLQLLICNCQFAIRLAAAELTIDNCKLAIAN